MDSSFQMWVDQIKKKKESLKFSSIERFITAAILARNSWVSAGVSNNTNQCSVPFRPKKSPDADFEPITSLETPCHTKRNPTLTCSISYTCIFGQCLINLTMKKCPLADCSVLLLASSSNFRRLSFIVFTKLRPTRQHFAVKNSGNLLLLFLCSTKLQTKVKWILTSIYKVSHSGNNKHPKEGNQEIVQCENCRLFPNTFSNATL